MVIDFSKINLQEEPVLILKNGSGVPLGALGFAYNVAPDIKYNEVSTLTFDLPAYVDNLPVAHYDDVIGMRIVELRDVGQFILVNPEETGDGVELIKKCKAYSLEYEFSFKKITLENGTYEFWNPVAPENTILGILLELMPSWSVGSVDSSLVGKYRTYEISEENLYNFIKNTLQISYNCIFDFDTYNRKINVRDVSSNVSVNPLFISFENLVKEIKITEDTENIVTRLDVNGADGVDIRDVNPSGTNKIINLDYFMTPENFDQDLINKYYEWKEAYKNYQTPYYNLSIEYSLIVMRKVTENAALADLEGELTSLENIQAVIIQSIAKGIKTQDDLDEINIEISLKQAVINEKKAEIEEIEKSRVDLLSEMADINSIINFDNYFSEEEYVLLDRYIKDDAVSESSFVYNETEAYSSGDIGNKVSDVPVSIKDALITKVISTKGDEIYDIKNGYIQSDTLSADIIRSAVEIGENNAFVMTAYLCNGQINERSFNTACLSITGTCGNITDDVKSNSDTPTIHEGTFVNFDITEGFLFFTLNTSEYEKRAVAWDLYEYGNEILTKISQPSFNFSVDSANFLYLEDYNEFKKAINHGEKLYIKIAEDEILTPIAIGAKFEYDSPTSLTLEFSDSYLSGDSSFQLADLLEQSVSMGKNVNLSKYTYSAFIDSGANTEVKAFMTNALDVARNNIMSSKNQAISWSDSGIRLRKWADEAHTSYDPQQIWMNNNSILMTSNNWAGAEIAIGNFYDSNLGDCWGIVAPNIVGTLLAGSNLVIESAKKDGGITVFRVDAEGCVLHNSNFSITSASTNTHILLDPRYGIAIGEYPLINSEGDIDESKSKFWVDTTGNLFFKGTLRAANGEFDGKVTAREGYIGDGANGWTIGNTFIYNAKNSLNSATQGIYIGTDGIALGNASTYVKATKAGLLSANNVDISGKITATSGYIGGTSGWTIGSTYIYNGKVSYGSSTLGIYIGTNGIHLGGSDYSFSVTQNGTLTATSADIRGKITATSGTIGSGSTVWNIGGGSIWSGKNSFASTTSGVYIGVDGIHLGGTAYSFKVDSAGNVTMNRFNATGGTVGGWSIDSGKIYAGNGSSVKTAFMQAPSGSVTWVFGAGGSSHSNYADCPFRVDKDGYVYASNVQISGNITATGGTIGGCAISNGNININSDRVNSGVLNTARIPNLSADKITTGTLDAGRITVKNLNADNITSGTLNLNNISLRNNGAELLSVDGGLTTRTIGIEAYLNILRFQEASQYYGSINMAVSGAGDFPLLGMNGSPSASYSFWLSSKKGRLDGTWYGTSGTSITSDRNKKKDIFSISDKYEPLFDKLTPSTFKYNDGTSSRLHTGFISQDVKQAMDEINMDSSEFAGFVVKENNDGTKDWYLRYDEFVALNTWQIQKLKARVTELEKKLNSA